MSSDMGVFFGMETPYRQIFYTNYAAAATQLSQIWTKPRGLTAVHFTVISGAGGGGAGLTGAASSARGGGGGGGPGGYVAFVMPAAQLPDRLYVVVGHGGKGAASSGSNGVAGDVSVVAMQPGTIS